MKNTKTKKELTANQKKGRNFLIVAGIVTILIPGCGAGSVLAMVGMYHLMKDNVKTAEEDRYQTICKQTGQMTDDELATVSTIEEISVEANGEEG